MSSDLRPGYAELRALLETRVGNAAPFAHEILDCLQQAGALSGASPDDLPDTSHGTTVHGLRLTWSDADGTFRFAGLPAAMMWVDTTLDGLWTGIHEMVGEERFGLALRKQGRNSVVSDWQVIQAGGGFPAGFSMLANVASAAGWGRWTIQSYQPETQTVVFRVRGGWERGLVERHDGWGIHFLAGKFAGYGSCLFACNCWADVQAVSDDTLQIVVKPSSLSLEAMLDELLHTDAATRADLAVAVQRLRKEVAERERIAEALLVAKRDAEAATRSKSQFLANMSHELRTPLHGMLGSLELLTDAGLPAKEQEVAQGALDSARSLLSIVGELLDLSRIEAGRLVLEEADFDLRWLVQSAVDLLHPTAVRRGLYLRCEIEPSLATSRRGDAGRIRQVVLNLVSNALKFTPEGGVRVLVGAAQNNQVCFRVQDTGIGIPEDRLSHIFEPFRQIEDGNHRRYGGAGLGLAICTQLATLLNGTMSVESHIGQGSTFTLTIPLEMGSDTSNPQLEADAIPNKFDAKILIVDDSDINRTIARMMLEGLGCQTCEAVDGLSALGSLQNTEVDLVLMDVMMPIMDGIQATRRYRALEKDGNQLPIIAMTANAMVGDREECLAAGMNDYLPKPVRREVLQRTLARWLAPHPERRSPSRA